MRDTIVLQGVPETMLQTLYARARETRQARPAIRDEKAAELVERLDYDFSGAERDKAMRTGVIARTILLDRMCGEFLEAHPGSLVVNLACGLDTRCYRMNGKYKCWYNLDLPETMAVRARLLPETGEIRQIACSALDAAWTQEVSAAGEPVLVIIEGLAMYLQEDEVLQLFALIRRAFTHATVLVETMNPFVAAHVKETSIEGSRAKFTWGIKDGEALQRLLPEYRHVRDVSLTEGMQEFIPLYKLLGKIGFIRNISNKLLELSF